MLRTVFWVQGSTKYYYTVNHDLYGVIENVNGAFVAVYIGVIHVCYHYRMASEPTIVPWLTV